MKLHWIMTVVGVLLFMKVVVVGRKQFLLYSLALWIGIGLGWLLGH